MFEAPIDSFSAGYDITELWVEEEATVPTVSRELYRTCTTCTETWCTPVVFQHPEELTYFVVEASDELPSDQISIPSGVVGDLLPRGYDRLEQFLIVEPWMVEILTTNGRVEGDRLGTHPDELRAREWW